MRAKVEDRRVQRTRTLLLDALLDLITEKGCAAVTGNSSEGCQRRNSPYG